MHDVHNCVDSPWARIYYLIYSKHLCGYSHGREI